MATQKESFLEKAKNVPDYYQGFDVGLWVSSSKTDTVGYVFEFMAEYPEATSVELIAFRRYAEDKVKAGEWPKSS